MIQVTVLDGTERTCVLPGENPQVIGRKGGVRDEGNERLAFFDNADTGFQLIRQHPAIEAVAGFLVITPRLLQPGLDLGGDDRSRRDLGMGMFQRSSGPLSVVLENDNALHGRIQPEGFVTLPIKPEKSPDMRCREIRQGDIVLRMLDDHLMGSGSRQGAESAFIVPFHHIHGAECGIFVGHDTHLPAAIRVAGSGDLGAAEVFIPGTKRAVLPPSGTFRTHLILLAEVVRLHRPV